MLFDADENEDEVWGFYEGQCAGCDVYGPIDDVGLCRECAAKLDRDLIRQRERRLVLPGGSHLGLDAPSFCALLHD